MPRRPLEQTKVETKLAAWRVRRGVTQEEMAKATGISYSTYWRLERGRYRNPPIGYLINCALALGCELNDILEQDQTEWHIFDRRAATPPKHAALWREADG
jgi:transcriptional regulator with XRE-family HTH domain